MVLIAYIKAKLRKLNLSMDDAEIEVMLTEQGADPVGELTPASIRVAKQVIVAAIPELLLAPDISQGDFSRKFDRNAVIAYYGMLCDELGLENKLTPQPKVVDRSNLW